MYSWEAEIKHESDHMLSTCLPLPLSPQCPFAARKETKCSRKRKGGSLCPQLCAAACSSLGQRHRQGRSWQGQGDQAGTGILGEGREQLLVRDVSPGLIPRYSPPTPT